MGTDSPQPSTSPRLLTRRRVLLGSAALLAATGTPGLFGSETIRVRRSTLRLPKWDADGFRVAQVSDLHTNSTSQRDRARQAIEMAVAEKPDLLVLNGDFLDSTTEDVLKNLRHALEPLRGASCPIAGVYGNHDWSTSALALFVVLRSFDLSILFNESIEVDGVTVAGVDDALFNRARVEFLADADKYSKSVLVMWHEPDPVGFLPKSASLQLSGHSHGGEVCLPGGKPIHLPRGAERYSGGFYPDAPTPLYVSRGVATVGLFRLYCPPEISMLTIRSSKGGPASEEVA